jgi:hypothetical protein
MASAHAAFEVGATLVRRFWIPSIEPRLSSLFAALGTRASPRAVLEAPTPPLWARLTGVPVHTPYGSPDFDESKLIKWNAGDYFTVSVGTPHYVLTKDSSPVFELHVMGPWQMTYANPDDHPHK